LYGNQHFEAISMLLSLVNSIISYVGFVLKDVFLIVS
jgi:hypothetical protein